MIINRTEGNVSISRTLADNNKMAVRIVGVFIFMNCFIANYASYHWKVTENGRISSQVEKSGFPLTRQDDLLALLEQEERLGRASELHRELITLKSSIYRQWNRIEGEGDFEKRLYASDIDCLLGEVPLVQQNLNIEFLDYAQGSRLKMKNNYETVEPDCTVYSELDFSMRTFPHLETLNRRNNFSLSVHPVPWTSKTKSVFDFNIDAMLRHNSSDWTAYNLASLYWRTIGNGTNALECARRALYFSPWNKRYIVLLNLGTLLQELESLGEAAIVLHSAVDHDPECHISHLALGNVYAALGDYNRSLACYDNVLSLNPGNGRALKLKHALLCHKKLVTGLLELHASLQRILHDLQKHNALHEEWLLVQNQVNWERNSKLKEFYSFSQPIYLNLQMLLQDVEHQAKVLNQKAAKKAQAVANEADSTRQRTSETFEDLGEEEDEDDGGDGGEEDEDGINSEKFVGSDVIKKRINSLISLIRSNYKEEFNFLDFKRKMKENAHVVRRQKRVEVVKKVDSCVKESKKLN